MNKSMTHSEIFGLDGILDVEDEPLVSMDFNTNPNSKQLLTLKTQL